MVLSEKTRHLKINKSVHLIFKEVLIVHLQDRSLVLFNCIKFYIKKKMIHSTHSLNLDITFVQPKQRTFYFV